MNKNELRNVFFANVIGSLLFIIFGVYLFYKPTSTVTFISTFLGIILAIIGIIGLYKFITREDKKKKFDLSLIYMIISFVAALILFIKPTLIKDGLQVTFGIIMVAFPFLKIKYVKELFKCRDNNIGLSIFSLMVMFLLGIVVLINPTREIVNINIILGLFIFFYSIINIITSYLFYNNIEDIRIIDPKRIIEMDND
jgi:uncharacterized membrane protein HdeD (DUF308 family)